MIESTFSHIGLNCRDPIALERFYGEYFGFKRARVYGPGPDQVVMLRAGNVYLELFKAEGDDPRGEPTKDGFTQTGYRHMAFQVEDLDAKVAELEGVCEVSLGPLDFSQFLPGLRAVWLKDPEGNVVEVLEGYSDDPTPPPLG